jgi:hypothetical protein
LSWLSWSCSSLTDIFTQFAYDIIDDGKKADAMGKNKWVALDIVY